MQVVKRDGSHEPLYLEKIQKCIDWACDGLELNAQEFGAEVKRAVFNGIKTADIHRLATKIVAQSISVKRQNATFAAARLLLQEIYKEESGDIDYRHLRKYLYEGHGAGRLAFDLLTKFDLERLNDAIKPERDFLFTYLGLQTLADRYLIRETPEGRIIERPQHFWMRVAMGVALLEDDPTARAIEFYNVLSTLEFVSSTPTLFNAGTLHPQLSSCYGNTVSDTIVADSDQHEYASIFGAFTECALLSKYAGGIGTDWTRVRSEGDHIKGTSGKSSGVVPYLKVYNDVAVAVNQGGLRKGSFAPYIEPWHPDFLDFIELKKQTGDERKRAHEIYPAGWIPDLFMKRVKEKGVWSFFSPKDYPELHELWGDEFEWRYCDLEAAGKFVRQMPAVELWRKWLTMLFETGHPWFTFKDECNRRNPQDHVGVIHNSNLCTEITLNNSDTETFVCNLGSVNLARCSPQKDLERFRYVVRTGMRMLDNVIDINFYPSDRAKSANLRHRPVGMGVMGYTEWLVQQGLDWESEEHLEAADRLFEQWSYLVIEASSDLAAERGEYNTFVGSKWHRGILPISTARNRMRTLDWEALRAKVITQGMRNSNCMAIAPTATISNIAGTTPCIEPIFELEFSKGNLSGDFKVIDPCLKYGRPELCKTAFQIDPKWVLRCAAVRQKWIDQAQSTNLWVKAGTKGKDLADIYMKAWELGLKTTYYLKNQSSVVLKDVPKLGEQQGVKLCSLDDPTCEACQ